MKGSLLPCIPHSTEGKVVFVAFITYVANLIAGGDYINSTFLPV
jgi:hypothetical protein